MVGVPALDAVSDAFFTSSVVALDDSAPESLVTFDGDCCGGGGGPVGAFFIMTATTADLAGAAL